MAKAKAMHRIQPDPQTRRAADVYAALYAAPCHRGSKRDLQRWSGWGESTVTRALRDLRTLGFDLEYCLDERRWYARELSAQQRAAAFLILQDLDPLCPRLLDRSLAVLVAHRAAMEANPR